MIFTPIKQFFYFDALECLPQEDSPYYSAERELFLPKQDGRSRYEGQVAVMGWKMQEALAKQRWFIVRSHLFFSNIVLVLIFGNF